VKENYVPHSLYFIHRPIACLPPCTRPRPGTAQTHGTAASLSAPARGVLDAAVGACETLLGSHQAALSLYHHLHFPTAAAQQQRREDAELLRALREKNSVLAAQNASLHAQNQARSGRMRSDAVLKAANICNHRPFPPPQKKLVGMFNFESLSHRPIFSRLFVSASRSTFTRNTRRSARSWAATNWSCRTRACSARPFASRPCCGTTSAA
jgi:hypothetical protein